MPSGLRVARPEPRVMVSARVRFFREINFTYLIKRACHDEGVRVRVRTRAQDGGEGLQVLITTVIHMQIAWASEGEWFRGLGVERL